MTIPEYTPAKKAFIIHSNSLKEAITLEWKDSAKFSANKMPLTSLAYTAIDRIKPQCEAIIDALLVYADTDSLCYLATEADLKSFQQQKTKHVISWCSNFLGEKWQITEGIMPLDQSAQIHKSLRKYLKQKDNFTLAAFTVLAGGFSSLILAIAVVENYLNAEDAFGLSRLEEEYNMNKWGEDSQALARAKRIKKEIVDADKFLKLLDA